MGRSLRQQWQDAAAAKIVDDVDPEDLLDGAVLDERRFAVDDDADELKENARRHMPALEAMGERYQGRIVSRKQLAGSSDEDSEADNVIDDDGLLNEFLARSGAASSASDDSEEVSDSEMILAEEEPLEASTVSDLQRIEEEDSAALFRANTCGEGELRKAQHVRSQRRLWDATLDIRIRMQKALQLGNQEMVPSTQADEKTKDTIRGALDSLLSLQDELMDQDQRWNDVCRFKQRRRRSCDSYWKTMQKRCDGMRPEQDRIIDLWNRKTQLSSGASRTKSNTNFAALNRSVLSQIEDSIAMMPALIRHSQMNRADLAGTEPSEEDRNVEVYDDTPFYRSLLKELIASGRDGQASAAGMSAEALRKASSRRKQVDRRASKGRKLRYTPIPKLANFMAPNALGGEGAFLAVDELFTNLFGQRRARA